MAWIESIDVDVINFDHITMIGTCSNRLEAMIDTGQKVTLLTGIKNVNIPNVIKDIIVQNSELDKNSIIDQDAIIKIKDNNQINT